jgi:hypothetical protein
MKTYLTWSKGLFSDSYKIYDKGTQVGNLKDKFFSQSGIGILDKKEYLFQTTGFFEQKTQIIDPAYNKVVGEINYNSWMTKATIILNEQTLEWKYENLWSTKWSISNSEGIEINFSGYSTNGQIESNTDDALLLLSGLFVTNYYWQVTFVVLFVSFVPLWITIF